MIGEHKTKSQIDYVMDDLPMIQGFAFLAYEAEHNPWVPLDRATPGYIKQEIERLKAKC